MKRFFLFGLLFCSVALYADDCSDALNEAKNLYNAGNYSKAKSLFNYVASECGANYGDATTWSKKCTEKLTPRLTVSRTNISVGASSGTTSITVTSNREWKLQNTNSNMYAVSKNGNSVTINYYANSVASSRSDYFDIVTEDGSKSVRVRINQSAAPVTLSVSKTSISCSASGTTEYLTVNCNQAWEIQYPSGDMYSTTRNGNTVTVTINRNTSTASRTNYFNIKSTDGSKVVKISLSQTDGDSYATIEKVWVDHNVYENGQKGMRIHVKFDAYNVLNHSVKVCVYFHYSDGGNALKGIRGSGYCTSDGSVTVQSASKATYTNTTWSDFTLFMPYQKLNMQAGCKDVSLEGRVGILDNTTDKWLTTKHKKFSFTFSN
ncbi:MAG: hypothetical protein ACI4BD_05030 [Paludibacteraceae bacterium]